MQLGLLGGAVGAAGPGEASNLVVGGGGGAADAVGSSSMGTSWTLAVEGADAAALGPGSVRVLDVGGVVTAMAACALGDGDDPGLDDGRATKMARPATPPNTAAAPKAVRPMPMGERKRASGRGLRGMSLDTG